MVEHDLAKVGVASSSLVSRSSFLTGPRQKRGPVVSGPVTNGDGRTLQGPDRLRSSQSTGLVAEWSCSGLQSRVRRFDSDPGLAQRRSARVRSRPRRHSGTSSLGKAWVVPTRLHPEPLALPAAGPLRYPCSAPPVRTSLCGRRPARGCAARKPGRPRLTQGGLNHSWCLECAGQGGTVRLRPGWRNGRRRGLKIPYPQGCAGSSPAPGTTTCVEAIDGSARRQFGA